MYSPSARALSRLQPLTRLPSCIKTCKLVLYTEKDKQNGLTGRNRALTSSLHDPINPGRIHREAAHPQGSISLPWANGQSLKQVAGGDGKVCPGSLPQEATNVGCGASSLIAPALEVSTTRGMYVGHPNNKGLCISSHLPCCTDVLEQLVIDKCVVIIYCRIRSFVLRAIFKQ